MKATLITGTLGFALLAYAAVGEAQMMQCTNYQNICTGYTCQAVTQQLCVNTSNQQVPYNRITQQPVTAGTCQKGNTVCTTSNFQCQTYMYYCVDPKSCSCSDANFQCLLNGNLIPGC